MSSSLNNNNPSFFSESFLSYLNTESNIKSKTFCQENTNKYHDSSYIWCKVCDKIFCTQCSMNHLINNQINHCPTEKVFLRKEHFDVEFSRDFDKLKELKNKIGIYFSKKNSELTQNKINSLKDALDKFRALSNELFTNIIPKFIQIYSEGIQKLLKNIKNVKSYGLNEENVNIRYQEIFNKFTQIEKNYTKNEKFEPKMLKHYHDDLIDAYIEIKNLNELLNKNDMTSNDANDNFCCSGDYEKINFNLIKSINVVNNFKKDLSCHLNI